MTQLQEIFPTDPQASIDLGEPRQNTIGFPLTLAERYQPRVVADFIGLEYPKQVMISLLGRPKPCALLFIGPPGAGKTAMAMAFAGQLPGSLMHVSAQKCDVAALDRLNEQFAYYPPKGKFWICLVDEADQMTDKAQLQLLSRLDGTARLKPVYGGGFELGDPPPIIWIFTCNGRGPSETDPPASFLARFLSRCMQLRFHAASAGELKRYLERIWRLQAGGRELPDLDAIVRDSAHNVRDAMMQLDLALMASPAPATSDEEEAKRWNQAGAKRTAEDIAASRRKAKEILERFSSPTKPVEAILPSAVSEAVSKLSAILGEREAETLLQRAIRDCGQRLMVDGRIGALTIKAANRLPELKLLAAIERRRAGMEVTQ